MKKVDEPPSVVEKDYHQNMIESLLSALEGRKKFRQLSCYAIECIAKALQETNPRWQEIRDRAIELGGIDIFINLIKNYPGDNDVLGRCALCLMRFSVEKRAASEIFHKNAIEYYRSEVCNP